MSISCANWSSRDSNAAGRDHCRGRSHHRLYHARRSHRHLFQQICPPGLIALRNTFRTIDRRTDIHFWLEMGLFFITTLNGRNQVLHRFFPHHRVVPLAGREVGFLSDVALEIARDRVAPVAESVLVPVSIVSLDADSVRAWPWAPHGLRRTRSLARANPGSTGTCSITSATPPPR